MWICNPNILVCKEAETRAGKGQTVLLGSAFVLLSYLELFLPSVAFPTTPEVRDCQQDLSYAAVPVRAVVCGGRNSRLPMLKNRSWENNYIGEATLALT